MSFVRIKSAAHYAKYQKGEKGYFDNERRADGSIIDSLWLGRGAEMLGVEGLAVRPADFALGLDGVPPGLDEDARIGKRGGRGGREKHRPGDEFNLAFPKSFSLYAVHDPRMEDLMWQAAATAIKFLETEAIARVTSNRKTQWQKTKNLTVAAFFHRSNRDNEAHYHVHLAVLNMTHSTSHGWRALEPKEMYELQYRARDLWFKSIAAGAKEMGLQLRWERDQRGRLYPEIASVSREQILHFSSGHRRVQEKLKTYSELDHWQAQGKAFRDQRKPKQNLGSLADWKAAQIEAMQAVGIEFRSIDKVDNLIVRGNDEFIERAEVGRKINAAAARIKKAAGRATEHDEHGPRPVDVAASRSEGNVTAREYDADPFSPFRVGAPTTSNMLQLANRLATEKGVALPHEIDDLGVARAWLNQHAVHKLPTISPRDMPRTSGATVEWAEPVAAARAEEALDRFREELIAGGTGDYLNIREADTDTGAHENDHETSGDTRNPEDRRNGDADIEHPAAPAELGIPNANRGAPLSTRQLEDSRHSESVGTLLNRSPLFDQLREATAGIGVRGLREAEMRVLDGPESRLAELDVILAGSRVPDRASLEAEQKFLQRAELEHRGHWVEIDGKLYTVQARDAAEQLAGGFRAHQLTGARGKVVQKLITHGPDNMLVGIADRVNQREVFEGRRNQMTTLRKVDTRSGFVNMETAQGQHLAGRVYITKYDPLARMNFMVLKDHGTNHVLGTVVIDHKTNTAFFMKGQQLLKDKQREAWEKRAERFEKLAKQTYFHRGTKMYRRGWFGRVHRVKGVERAAVYAVMALGLTAKTSGKVAYLAAKTMVKLAAGVARDVANAHDIGNPMSAFRLQSERIREGMLRQLGYSRGQVRVSMGQDRAMSKMLTPRDFREYLVQKYAGSRSMAGELSHAAWVDHHGWVKNAARVEQQALAVFRERTDGARPAAATRFAAANNRSADNAQPPLTSTRSTPTTEPTPRPQETGQSTDHVSLPSAREMRAAGADPSAIRGFQQYLASAARDMGPPRQSSTDRTTHPTGSGKADEPLRTGDRVVWRSSAGDEIHAFVTRETTHGVHGLIDREKHPDWAGRDDIMMSRSDVRRAPEITVDPSSSRRAGVAVRNAAQVAKRRFGRTIDFPGRAKAIQEQIQARQHEIAHQTISRSKPSEVNRTRER